ncbi:MAG: molybdenum cofactor guanylyltransferase [Pirellulaceae bacterium]|nr:molybdenum cofactor guanylyltransferase [Pirellulaceae bacterium]
MSEKLLGVVLCGGKSSRMGRDKSLLGHPDGGTYLDQAVKRLSDVCGEVCIAGTQDQNESSIVPFLVDPVLYQGPVVGIVNGLLFAQQQSCDACLVLAVDMPVVVGADLRNLKDAWLANRQSCPDEVICGLCDTDRIQPLLAIYPVGVLKDLQRLAGSADRSLFRWIKTVPHRTVSLSATSCVNVNSPDDLPLQ